MKTVGMPLAWRKGCGEPPNNKGWLTVSGCTATGSGSISSTSTSYNFVIQPCTSLVDAWKVTVKAGTAFWCEVKQTNILFAGSPPYSGWSGTELHLFDEDWYPIVANYQRDSTFSHGESIDFSTGGGSLIAPIVLSATEDVVVNIVVSMYNSDPRTSSTFLFAGQSYAGQQRAPVSNTVPDNWYAYSTTNGSFDYEITAHVCPYSSSYSDIMLEDSPWGYWSLQSDFSDESGNGRNLTALSSKIDTAAITSPWPTSLQRASTSVVSYAYNNTDDFTYNPVTESWALEFWYLNNGDPPSPGTTYYTAANLGSSAPSTLGQELEINPQGRLQYTLYSCGTYPQPYVATSSDQFGSEPQWVHLVFMWDRLYNFGKVYMNGHHVGYRTMPCLTDVTKRLTLLCYYVSSGSQMDMQMAQAALHVGSRLSPGRIAARYAKGLELAV